MLQQQVKGLLYLRNIPDCAYFMHGPIDLFVRKVFIDTGGRADGI